jgi:hypothetical protein
VRMISSLPSWPCRFDPGHPLHAFPQVNRLVRPSGEALQEPPGGPLNPFSTPVFRCVGHEWVTPLGREPPRDDTCRTTEAGSAAQLGHGAYRRPAT